MYARYRTLLIPLAACLLAGTAHASDSYQAAIEGCEQAIGAQLGVTDQAVSYKLKKVKSSAKHRDLGFSVSVLDDASPVQQAKVSCRARKDGEVLTVAFADPSLPQALATH
ncbi:MAG: hypothetical protein HC809_07785 [Gammaproteobacteria bacterium]|nr:hypothetical protein [Gammaproteobacteria bacterium]